MVGIGLHEASLWGLRLWGVAWWSYGNPNRRVVKEGLTTGLRGANGRYRRESRIFKVSGQDPGFARRGLIKMRGGRELVGPGAGAAKATFAARQGCRRSPACVRNTAPTRLRYCESYPAAIRELQNEGQLGRVCRHRTRRYARIIASNPASGTSSGVYGPCRALGPQLAP
jgi:hypothetical protein